MFAEKYIVRESLLLSLGLHLLILYKGHFVSHRYPAQPVEIDLASAGLILGSVEPAARARTITAVKAPSAQKEPLAQPPSSTLARATALEPSPSSPSSSASAPPAEPALGTEQSQGAALMRVPQLLNSRDLAALLRRFYPEAARADLRQATVVLEVSIDAEGHVQSAEVVQSGGPDFDAAALKVARLLRFTPAYNAGQRVAVKMRQAIQFKLEG